MGARHRGDGSEGTWIVATATVEKDRLHRAASLDWARGALTWLAALLIAGACGRPAPEERGEAFAALDPQIDVSAARVERGSIVQPVLAPGSLVARRESRIGAEVRARIVRVHVAEGDRVEAGDPLFQIDPAAYEMALRQATAGVDVARAERRQLEADLVRARHCAASR